MQILKKKDARQAILKGVRTLVDVVTSTLGAKGRNVAYYDDYGNLVVTNDGVSIAKQVSSSDPSEQMGIDYARNPAIESGDEAGDGTTTATALIGAMVEIGNKFLEEGSSPIAMKRGIEAAVAEAVEYLKGMSITEPTLELLSAVATTSANNDPVIGSLITEALSKNGPSGSIRFEESKTSETYIEVYQGMELEAGLTAMQFVTDMSRRESVLENVHVLVYNSKLSDMKSLVEKLMAPVFEADKNASFLIVADDYDPVVLNALVVNRLKNGLKIAAVKAPYLGQQRRDIMEDVALYTGATLCSDSLNTGISEINRTYLGHADKVIINHKSTIIIGAKGKPDDIDRKVQALKLQELEAETSGLKAELKQRIGGLTGGVACIYVGANTPVELKEKTDRVEDAVLAVNSAVKEGVLPGGGIALFTASALGESLERTTKTLTDFEKGKLVVFLALTAPFYKIMENADIPSDKANFLATTRNNLSEGVDANTGELCDMYERGIVDPLKVVRMALENAASATKMILLTDAIIVADKPQKNES